MYNIYNIYNDERKRRCQMGGRIESTEGTRLALYMLSWTEYFVRLSRWPGEGAGHHGRSDLEPLNGDVVGLLQGKDRGHK